MSHEKHVRKQVDAHELQQARCLSKLKDGFTEETLQKLDRKISTYFALIIVHLSVNKQYSYFEGARSELL